MRAHIHRILWTEKPGGLQSLDHKELDTAEGLTRSLSFPQGVLKPGLCPVDASGVPAWYMCIKGLSGWITWVT